MTQYFFDKTYAPTEELRRIKPLLLEATEFQRKKPGYISPYAYWADSRGWLYIKWTIDESSDRKPVCRYSHNEKGELIAEEIPVKVSRVERLRGSSPGESVVLVTGDTHGHFERIIRFCEYYKTTKNDLMIILGDACINYFGGKQDDDLKYHLSKLPITFFCIHGNHERRPDTIEAYSIKEWHGGKVFVEDQYPNIIFSKDGEIYDIAGYKTIVIGGAYSIDKHYRLSVGQHWFEDEQPSEEIKRYVESQLEKNNWSVDAVLSHTLPRKYIPVDCFIRDIDQKTVDKTTELWLGTIEERLSYKKWYGGHFHCDRDIDDIRIMFKRIERYMDDTDLKY